jgi:hypothetical protein
MLKRAYVISKAGTTKRFLLYLSLLTICTLATLRPESPVTSTSANERSIAYGAAVPGVPWNLRSLDQQEFAIGNRNAIVNFFWSWDEATQAPDVDLFGRIAARGSVPMVTWMPQDYRRGQNQPDFSLTSIASGKYDRFVSLWAFALARYNRPVLLRFAHEMNGDWYPWSSWRSGNTAESYVAAWRHIHDIFAFYGAANVFWVWSPNVENADPAPYFPGDKYVDWIALDGYTSASWRERSFTDLFYSSYARITSLSSRPVMIAEVGIDESSPEYKSAWITSAYRKEIPQNFPRVAAVLWFDENRLGKEPYGKDWSLMSSESSLNAYATSVASSPYSSSLTLYR